MSFASDSSNGGFAPACLYMSWSLSSRLFSIVQTVVPSGLCRVVYVVGGAVRVRIGGLDGCLGPG